MSSDIIVLGYDGSDGVSEWIGRYHPQLSLVVVDDFDRSIVDSIMENVDFSESLLFHGVVDSRQVILDGSIDEVISLVRMIASRLGGDFIIFHPNSDFTPPYPVVVSNDGFVVGEIA